MTYLLAIFALAMPVAAITKVVLASSWRVRAKLTVLSVGLVSWPLLAWWAAFNSLSSGWGFGLIAIGLSIIVGLGVIVGGLWHSFSRPA